MMAHAFNPSTQRQGQRQADLRVPGHSGSHGEFQNSRGYLVRPSFHKQAKPIQAKKQKQEIQMF